MAKTLNNDDWTPLYCSNNENKIYYKYNKYLNAHFYYMDYKAVLDDANARNSAFMEILKGDLDIENT